MTLPEEPILSGPDAMGAELASWGRVLLIETRGHRTGARRITAVGFVEEPDGAYLVAAGAPETSWARNLQADPRCRISFADIARDCRAEPLGPEDAQRAVVALILRYGTPAEGLGRGPAFRLLPIATDGRDPA